MMPLYSSDILKYFSDLNSNLLDDMFSNLQSIYAKNVIYKEKRRMIDILVDEYERIAEKLKQILEKEAKGKGKG